MPLFTTNLVLISSNFRFYRLHCHQSSPKTQNFNLRFWTTVLTQPRLRLTLCKVQVVTVQRIDFKCVQHSVIPQKLQIYPGNWQWDHPLWLSIIKRLVLIAQHQTLHCRHRCCLTGAFENHQGSVKGGGGGEEACGPDFDFRNSGSEVFPDFLGSLPVPPTLNIPCSANRTRKHWNSDFRDLCWFIAGLTQTLRQILCARAKNWGLFEEEGVRPKRVSGLASCDEVLLALYSS